MSDDLYSLKMTPADYQRWQDARGNVEDATAILETVKRQRATEPRYAAILEQVKDLLVGQPKKIRGHGDMECGPLRCIEIHALGGIGPHSFSGDTPLWGTSAPGMLMGEWNLHDEKYDRLWGSFPGPNGTITEDYPEALSH